KGVGAQLAAVLSAGANSGAVVGAVQDNEDGTYTVTYTPPAAGDDEITITLADVEISGSPYTSTVQPGPISGGANGTEISADVATVIANGVSAATITVQLKDEHGNVVEQAGVEVSFLTTHGDLSSAT